jgi:hypothetical protein
MIAEHDQGVALMEQQLPFGVPKCGVAPLGSREPGQGLVRGAKQCPHPAQR